MQPGTVVTLENTAKYDGQKGIVQDTKTDEGFLNIELMDSGKTVNVPADKVMVQSEDNVVSEKPKHAGGRPTKKTPEVIKEILDRISFGESLRQICKDDHLPEGRTVWDWLRNDNQFSQQYAQAKEEQADSLEDMLMTVAADEKDVARARLKVDVMKWSAAKLKPKKYGDRLISENENITVVRFADKDDKQLNEFIESLTGAKGTAS